MRFGLIGYPLGHSFSKDYFAEKFRAEGHPDFTYENFEYEFLELIFRVLPEDIFGLNVTIPFKTEVLRYLNELDDTASAIGAVNTLVRTGSNSWKGFNTDVLGFRESLEHWFAGNMIPEKALIIGTGGASKAVSFALTQLHVAVTRVSSSGNGDIGYDALDRQMMLDHRLIINTSPVGMEPHADDCPNIPYQYLTADHWLFDLIYNPVNTLFLTHGQQAGAKTKNGLEMLHLQADHAWAIWKTYGKF